jgi:hypothetical protein
MQAKGLGVAAISYDPADVVKRKDHAAPLAAARISGAHLVLTTSSDPAIAVGNGFSLCSTSSPRPGVVVCMAVGAILLTPPQLKPAFGGVAPEHAQADRTIA